MAQKPKNKLIALVVPAARHEALAEMATAAGEPIEDLCEKLLADIVEDDRAAHAEAA